MFNNAGVLGNQSKNKSIVNFDADEFDRVMSVNVKGVALGIKHAAKAMIPQGFGCIISSSSVAGVMGGLGPHAYTTSKHAIVGLTKNTSCELGRFGIRVNCISPFGVATSMLVNAWRKGDEEIDDDINFGLPLHEEVEKMEEFVRGLANLRGATLRAQDIAEAVLYQIRKPLIPSLSTRYRRVTRPCVASVLFTAPPSYCVNGNDKYSFSHVDDVVEGHIAAMKKGQIGERYLLTGENASFNQVFDMVAVITNTRKPMIRIPLWVIEAYGWLLVLYSRITGTLPFISPPTVNVLRHQWGYSCEKAKRELDYKPRSLREGLAEVLLWLKNLGLIRY